jgi:hypothetical protein
MEAADELLNHDHPGSNRNSSNPQVHIEGVVFMHLALPSAALLDWQGYRKT